MWPPWGIVCNSVYCWNSGSSVRSLAVSIIIRLITYSRSLYCLLSLKTLLNARLYDFFSQFPPERTTSRIPVTRANKSRPHPEPKFWWIPLLGKQSNPVSRQDILRLPESRTVFWSNLGSRKYPSRPSANYNTRPLIPPATQATSDSRVSIRVPLTRPFPHLFVYRSPVAPFRIMNQL